MQPNQYTSKELQTKIVTLLEDLKAQDIQVFNMSESAAIAEYIVICHGTSSAHLNGIQEHVYLTMKKEDSILPLGVEGVKEQTWILMDYNSVILHLFLEEERQFYQLEEIFSKSERDSNVAIDVNNSNS